MNDEGRIVLIGGGGMVGRRLIKDLPESLVVTSSRAGTGDYKLDLSNFTDTDLGFIGVNDTVLLAAAISSPDICKRDPEYAYSVNVVGTQKVIASCLSKGAKVVFLSSDTVYGSTVTPAKENIPFSPAGRYAEMKAEIEEIFSKAEHFLALRLSYVVSAQDKFTQYLFECADRKRSAEVFHPLSRNAVWIGDLVIMIGKLVEEFPTDIQSINIGGPSLVSRVDMANAFSMNIDDKFKFEIVEPDAEFYSDRPVTISMNTQQLERFIGRKPCDIQTAYRNEINLLE